MTHERLGFPDSRRLISRRRDGEVWLFDRGSSGPPSPLDRLAGRVYKYLYCQGKVLGRREICKGRKWLAPR